MDTTPMASVDEKIRITSHEVLGHPNLNTIRQKAVWVGLESLDIAEDVIPPPTVEPNRVVSELIQYLIHLEYCRKCLYKNRRSYTSSFYSCHFLCLFKHILPYLCFPV